MKEAPSISAIQKLVASLQDFHKLNSEAKEIVKTALEEGMDPNQSFSVNLDEYTILGYAIAAGDIQLFRLAIRFNADPFINSHFPKIGFSISPILYLNLFNKNIQPTNISLSRSFFEMKQSLSKKAKSLIEEKLTKTYLALGHLVFQEHGVAKEKGLNLLLLIGERHRTKYSLALEILIILLCRHINIKDICYESDQKRYDSSKSLAQTSLLFLYRNITYLLNMPSNHVLGAMHTLEKITTDIKANFHLVDNDFRSYDYAISEIGIKTRNTVMATEMAKINADSILMVGAMHLYGLITETDLNKKYHIFALNTGNFNCLDFSLGASDYNKKCKDYLEHKLTTHDAVFFNQDDIAWLNMDEIIEMIRNIQEENLYAFAPAHKKRRLAQDTNLEEVQLPKGPEIEEMAKLHEPTVSSVNKRKFVF